MRAPLLKNVNWLRAVPGGNHLVIECDRCDRKDEIYFPVTAEALVYLTRGYQEVHRDCRPRVQL